MKRCRICLTSPIRGNTVTSLVQTCSTNNQSVIAKLDYLYGILEKAVETSQANSHICLNDLGHFRTAFQSLVNVNLPQQFQQVADNFKEWQGNAEFRIISMERLQHQMSEHFHSLAQQFALVEGRISQLGNVDPSHLASTSDIIRGQT